VSKRCNGIRNALTLFVEQIARRSPPARVPRGASLSVKSLTKEIPHFDTFTQDAEEFLTHLLGPQGLRRRQGRAARRSIQTVEPVQDLAKEKTRIQTRFKEDKRRSTQTGLENLPDRMVVRILGFLSAGFNVFDGFFLPIKSSDSSKPLGSILCPRTSVCEGIVQQSTPCRECEAGAHRAWIPRSVHILAASCFESWN
jgi:hypothetical protein